jgi:Ig-like domain from next to BRCA1 gene
MATSNAVPGFKASVDGLHFTNSFPSEPDLLVDLGPFGKVPIGDASNGLCGGMVYTVMDVFNAALPPIPDTTQPAPGSPLFGYIVSRLFASFDIPAGVLKYYEWMNTPDHDTGIWFVTRRGVSWKTIMEEWPRVKADIDGGMLSPLGLVTVYSADPTMMGHNHQVLAYAYEVDDANVLTLRLYDPNTSPTDADDVFLTIDLSNPTHTSPIKHNVDIGRDVRGFFRTSYAFSDPRSLEPTPPLPSNALYVSSRVPSPLVPGQVAQAEVTMQNLGGTTWTSTGANPFRLGAQNPQDNSTWGPNRVELPQDVAPGEEVTFRFPVTAPSAPGTYDFQWRMVQELVTWFGDFSADIPVVVSPVLKSMTTTVSPSSLPARRPVMVTVTAHDAVTGAALAGSVTVDGTPRGSLGTPFSLTIPAHRVRAADGTWEWVPVPPTGQVDVAGYHPAKLVFDLDD